MKRIAFKMKLFPGMKAEYIKRHEEIWPELSSLLATTGITNYSIFLDEETNILFGVMNVVDETTLANLPLHPVMQRWWAFMKDIMESNLDNSPVSNSLKEVFFLP